jgi:DNA-binding NarL/FixJ family response regulator
MTEALSTGASRRIRVLIADDHATVREGLTAIIGRQRDDMVVVAEAAAALTPSPSGVIIVQT